MPRAIMRPIKEPLSEYSTQSFEEYKSELQTKKGYNLTHEEIEYAEYEFFRTKVIKKGGLSLKKIKE